MNYEKKRYSFYRMASTYGLLMGLATVAIQFVFYLLEGKFDNSFIALMLLLAATITIVIKGTLDYRKSLDGYISYWNAVIYGVVIFLFAGIVSSIYSYVLNCIDPDYVFRQLEIYRQQMLSMGLTELKIEEIIAEMKTKIEYQMQHPFTSVLASALGNMFLGALFCLISSAFLKKNKPEIIYES